MESNYKEKLQKELTDWPSYLATVGYSVIGGMVIGGLPGGAISLAASMLDEYLIRQGYTTKHYLTTSLYWSTMVFNPVASFAVKIYPNLKALFHLGHYAMAGLTSYYTNDFLNFKGKIELPIDSFLTVNKLFDKEEIISSKEAERIYNKLLEDPSEALNIIVDDVKAIYNNDFLFTFIEINGLELLNTVSDNLFLKFLASYSANIFISQLIMSQVNSN